MKRFVTLVSLILVGCMVLSGCGETQQTSGSAEVATPPSDPNFDPVNEDGSYRFASMSVGGAWYVYATSVAELMKGVMPNITVDVLPHQGGIGNPILVATGEAELGLSFSSAQNWAYNGICDYEGTPYTNLRALVGGLSRPYRIGIMVNDSLGVNSFQEMIDKKMKIRLVTVQVGGLGETMARQVLESYGVTYDDIKAWGGTVTHADLAVATSQMKDGQSDVFIHNMSFQQPDITETMLRGGLKFLPIDGEQAEYLCETYGHVNDVFFEKDEFTGVTEPVHTIGYPTGIVVSTQMSEDVAYTITKAICENTDKLIAAHASLADFDPAKAGDEALNGYIPLHPGAEKYYREMGYMD